MSKLFESTAINGMNLSNRFVRSATWEGLATTDGAVTPSLTKRMVELAKGGIAIPLILVGGLRSFEVAEKTILDGTADYISMSRPFIREPDLINRWQSGNRGKAKCISDNLCFNPGFEGKGVYCVTKEREAEKKTVL